MRYSFSTNSRKGQKIVIIGIRDFVQNVQMKIGTSVEEIDVLNKKVF